MKLSMFFLLAFSVLTCICLHASPGCLDNSWHLEKPFDTKEYHVVTRKIGRTETYCPCPCRKLSLYRGQCLECGHKHEIMPWIIVRTPRTH